MRIKALSPEVKTFLRTGITISGVTQCISELVQNSLDAKSTSIAVRIDLENFIFQVIDNGRGLTRGELDMIGTRYMTNKCHSLKDLKTNIRYYGFRGEFLASLRECCRVVMLVSKVKDSDQTYCKVFHVNQKSHTAKKAVQNRLCVGTTVVVKDFMFNFPVRRDCIQPAVEMENVRQALISLSVINHKIQFILRNDSTKVVTLQTKIYRDAGDALKHHCNMKEDASLIPLSVNIPPFKIHAQISRETEQSDCFQFVYVNGRLVKNKHMSKILTTKLSKSFYLRNTGKKVKPTTNQPRETVHPVFLIHILCPYVEYEITSDPKKIQVEFRKWDIVTKCLEEVVHKFLLTESDLNFPGTVSEEDKEIVSAVEKVGPSLDEYPFKTNVMYGISVKRPQVDNSFHDASFKIPQTNKVSINESSNKTFLDLIKVNKGDIPIKTFGSENTVLESCNRSNSEVLKSYQLASIRSEVRYITNNTDSVLTSDPENPYPFKIPSKICKMKRKYLSEHITTESEADYTPAKQICSWDSRNSIQQVKPKNSILPIVNYEYFYNSIENLSHANQVLFDSMKEGFDKSFNQAVQIDLHRSIKENPNKDTLQFTQKKIIKYLNQDRSFTSCCSVGIQSTKIIKKENLNSMVKEVINYPKHNPHNQFCLQRNTSEGKSVIKQNKNVQHQLVINKKKPLNRISTGINFKKYELKQNWKIFSPDFSDVKISKRNKPLHLIRSTDKLQKNSTDPKSFQKHLINSNLLATGNKDLKINRTDNKLCSFKENSKLFQQNHFTKVFGIGQKDTIKRKTSQVHRLSTIKPVCERAVMNNNSKTTTRSSRNLTAEPESVKTKNLSLFGNKNIYYSRKKLTFPDCNDGNPTQHCSKFTDINYSKNSSLMFSSNTTAFRFEDDNLKRNSKALEFNCDIQKLNDDNNFFQIKNIQSSTSVKDKQNLNCSFTEDFLKNRFSNTLPQDASIDFSHLQKNRLVSPLTPSYGENLGDFLQSIPTKMFYKSSSSKSGLAGNVLKSNFLNYGKEQNKFVELLLHEKGYFSKENTPTFENKSRFLKHKPQMTESKETILAKPIENLTSKEPKSKPQKLETLRKATLLLPNSSDLPENFGEDKQTIKNLDSTEKSLTKKSPGFNEQNLGSSNAMDIFQESEPRSQPTKWNEEIIPGGRTVKINLTTGMSYFLSPYKGAEIGFVLHDRYWFIPKGASPILNFNKNSNENVKELSESEKDVVQNIVTVNRTTALDTVKWKESAAQDFCEVMNPLSNGDSIKNWSSSPYIKKPCVFSGESLHNAKVLGQVDNKYIAALLETTEDQFKVLVLFDQHAVDERIRLETLIAGYKKSDGQFESQSLNPGVKIDLTENEKELVAALQPKLSKLGIQWTIEDDRVLVTAVPLCLFNRIFKERNNELLENTIKMLIKQLLLSAEEKVIPSMPHILSDIINSEACRGAIKFGDSLGLEKCTLLISKLAQCGIPFQCAHGRPVLAPLTEIKETTPAIEQINLRVLTKKINKRLSNSLN